MGGITFYGFVIFRDRKKFLFNGNLKGFSEKHLSELFECLKCKPFKFFPIEYVSDVTLKGHRKIAGSINFDL